MAFTLAQVKQFYSENWKFDNMLNCSKIAVLFPNELRQDGGAFRSIVQFPIMTEVTLQEKWDQKTGFNEVDATEKIVKLELKQNFTSYTKIAKVNVPANWQSWATNKIRTINRQEATELDDFVLKQICTGVKNSIEGDAITKDNIVKSLKNLEKEAKKHKFRLEDALIFISSDVMVSLIDSKLSSVMNDIENTSATINRVLNRYNIIEANVDDNGFQMVAVLPQAFAWASAVETPLQAGEYVQGPFLGQIFTAVNKFYNGEVLMSEHVVGLKKKGGTLPSEESENKTNVNSLNNYKAQTLAGLETNYGENKDFENLKKDLVQKLTKAKNVGEVDRLKQDFEAKLNA